MKCLAAIILLAVVPVVPAQFKARVGYMTLFRAASDALDTRVSGKTTADEPLFTTRDNTGSGTYVRNATGILGSEDITPVSVYCDDGEPRHVVTLISPRHVLMADHYPVTNGSTIRFVTATGVPVNRVLSSTVTGVGSTDIRVGLLDSDVPGTLSFMKVLTVADLAKLSTTDGCPVYYIDQLFTVHVGARINSFVTDYIYLDAPPESRRLAFWTQAIEGDSSHPIFTIIDGQVILLAALFGPTGGPTPSAYISQINAAMTTLGGGYQLTQFSSTAYSY